MESKVRCLGLKRQFAMVFEVQKADGSHEAARIARMAEVGGASCLLVLPPHSIFMMGGQMRPEMSLAHFKTIADATDLPIIVFQYPASYAYPMDTLLRMIDEVPTIRAIKDWSPPMRHEQNIRSLQSLGRPVNVLSTNSSWLMSSLAMGCNGLLSGAGSVIADLRVALFVFRDLKFPRSVISALAFSSVL